MKTPNTPIRRISSWLALSALLCSVHAPAATPTEVDFQKSGIWGAGIAIGEPTGLVGKYWVSSEHAIDFGLAFSFNSYVLVYSDYLIHFRGAFGRTSAFVAQLSPYVGGGLVLAFAGSDGKDHGPVLSTTGNSVGLGVRVPFGIERVLPKTPLGVFIEIVPGISVIPRTAGYLGAAVGIRYYF